MGRMGRSCSPRLVKGPHSIVANPEGFDDHERKQIPDLRSARNYEKVLYVVLSGTSLVKSEVPLFSTLAKAMLQLTTLH